MRIALRKGKTGAQENLLRNKADAAIRDWMEGNMTGHTYNWDESCMKAFMKQEEGSCFLEWQRKT